MIVRLNAYQAVCDLCQAKSEVYHAHQTGALPLPSGWVLTDVQRLEEPIPATGSLGLWEWEE